MKNVFFTLAFMLICSFSFASTNIENNLDVNSENYLEVSIDFNSSMMSVENLAAASRGATYYCSVEDGHFSGEGFGRSSAQACRRARRALRRAH